MKQGGKARPKSKRPLSTHNQPMLVEVDSLHSLQETSTREGEHATQPARSDATTYVSRPTMPHKPIETLWLRKSRKGLDFGTKFTIT